MRGWVHGSHEGVSSWDGEEGPPDHGLVDVDPPGEDDVGDEAGVAEALEDDIVVVLPGWGWRYLLAR